MRTFLLAMVIAGVLAVDWHAAQAASVVRFVDASAIGGSNNGTSWDNAYLSLQSALADAAVDGDGDEIWVANGTYTPGLLRTDSFVLESGVAIYGGFAGGEVSVNSRDLQANATVLSGAIGSPSDDTDNTYQVVKGAGLLNTAILDGFVIEKGYANSGSAYQGAGIYLGGSAIFRNLEIRNNVANEDGAAGGGVYVNIGSPQFRNVTFLGNSASSTGGGIHINAGGPLLSNVTFVGNSAGEDGGAISSNGSALSVSNATFSGNGAPNGDALAAAFNGANITINNSILYDADAGSEISRDQTPNISVNDSIVLGTCAATGITCTNVDDVDPQLQPLAGNGGHTRTQALAPVSPAIDAGNDMTCESTDQRGQLRQVDGDFDGGVDCDKGAYEFSLPRIAFVSGSGSDPESVAAPLVSVAITNYTIGDVAVSYAVTSGSATGGADYTLAAGTLTFESGVDLVLPLPLMVINDALDEVDETLLISLSSPVNGTLGSTLAHQRTITDDDAAPGVGFAAASSSAQESVSPRTLTVALSAASGRTVTVQYAVTGGSATGNGTDYTLTKGTLTFAPGQTSNSVAAAVKDDFIVEPPETFVVALSSPGAASLGGTTAHTVTIANNDSGSCNGKPATIVGGGGANVLTGTAGPDVIVGNGGNDTIRGKGGKDTICGSAGNDTILGGAGSDTILGQAGRDDLRGEGGNDALKGGGANDKVAGGGGKDSLKGETGADSLTGGPGAGDRCDGGAGTDSLPASHGCEVVAGVP